MNAQQAYIVGAAMIPMAKYKDSSYSGLAVPAVLNALRSAGVEPARIEAVVCGHAFGGMLTGQRIAKDVGIGGVPVTNVDNACSGGASALHLAWKDVTAGRHDVVLVIGVDKLTQFGGGTLPLVAEDPEVQQGIVMPAVYAMRARRYLHERRASVEDLARVSVKARRHGARNPYAQFRSEVGIDEVLRSRPIADPLTLLQCCPTGDGAAAVIVVSEKLRRQLDKPAVRIAASVLHSGTATTGFRDMLRPEITMHCATDAYEMAGFGAEDIDVVELHDAFSIAELVYYEALGLCRKGESADFLRDGKSTYGGQVVVNPSGGLLSKGHPVGASGVAQAVEIYWQLTGQAGERQVPDARTGLSHVTGGGIAGLDHGACTVHLYEGLR
ncbi:MULTISPECIES: thiolase family protein [unclassified Achromobacter]|uniref:thiolase family protein n=1 Tax=unclassified Achromobacter TaxID=2626865 RepID=UPI000B51AB17|nr:MULTISPECIES: thiolase family protein [unclassified Achromobacter]OWT71563.1 propanoyl-CoA acyltransferase [Achromobacter sp. HZ34]OWT73220.1 propanoyl-CoA acyltransferase [Achromobacter sp. HZ28]